jgi:hypothetical protein
LAILAIAAGSASTAANAFDPHPGKQLGCGTQNVSGARHRPARHAARQRRDGRQRRAVASGDLTHGVPVEHGLVGFTVAGIPGPTVDRGAGVDDGTTRRRSRAT